MTTSSPPRTTERPHPLASVEQTWVPMRDGVLLTADIYRPPHGRVPALLLRTPYDRQYLRDRLIEVDPLLAMRRGYAVVIQDLRGRFASGGEFEALMPDAEDGADTIAWLRRQPWSDGRVMMVGASYGGCVQFQAARARPDGLVAIGPTVGGALGTIARPGGAVRIAAIDGWMAILVGEALRGKLDASVRCELEDFMRASPLDRFHAFIEPGTVAWQVLAPLRHWVSTSPSDRYWTETTAIPLTPLPAVHTTGYYDVCLEAAIEAYATWSAVADSTAPQMLTLGPWDHDLAAVYPDLLGTQSPPGLVALERQLAFFDVVLGRAQAEELAPVMSFVLGRNRWHEDMRWPPAGVKPLPLWLATDLVGSGRLQGGECDEQRTISYHYDPRDPVPTLGGANAVWGLAGPMEQTPVESRADVLTFTSAYFDSELELAGAPIARLVVSSSAPATDFIARLTLVEPDGRSFPLAHGIWGGRLADLPAAGPGLAYRRCEIQLMPIHIALAPGRRLRLQITSSCYPDIYPNPNTGHDLILGPPPRVQTAEQSLLLGGAEGSSLILPLHGARPREVPA
ncbi:MAG TPA: CocE/NonD family hydrolase [Solirubrobacteraceae bacterium]|nr:CocE/NonD family hydrolase [Solirubrobacteraceae bacterium]